MRVSGLFAGIGGVELGLHQAGHDTALLCEIEPGAQAVLRDKFPGVRLASDVRALSALPRGTELLAGGFPCQDLSQAGKTKGIIEGKNSGLVSEVFRLVEHGRVPHVLLENVSFMLALERGAAMRYLTSRFEALGYRWAYRVLDTRAFGLPQRRQRLYFLASREWEPAEVLFHGSEPDAEPPYQHGLPCGFYWTEGVRGLGWAVNAVPTLKGGSTIGIASPPAIWLPTGEIVTPDIRDAERMQGFPAEWTMPALAVSRPGHRWKLVGNAVSVPVARWVGQRLADGPRATNFATMPLDPQKAWPIGAFGGPGLSPLAVRTTMRPVQLQSSILTQFLQHEPKLLSQKATAGFLKRLDSGNLRCPPEFKAALRAQMASYQTELQLAVA